MDIKISRDRDKIFDNAVSQKRHINVFDIYSALEDLSLVELKSVCDRSLLYTFMDLPGFKERFDFLLTVSRRTLEHAHSVDKHVSFQKRREEALSAGLDANEVEYYVFGDENQRQIDFHYSLAMGMLKLLFAKFSFEDRQRFLISVNFGITEMLRKKGF